MFTSMDIEVHENIEIKYKEEIYGKKPSANDHQLHGRLLSGFALIVLSLLHV